MFGALDNRSELCSAPWIIGPNYLRLLDNRSNVVPAISSMILSIQKTGVIIMASSRLMSMLFATGYLMAIKMVNMAYMIRSSTKLTYVASSLEKCSFLS